MGLSVAGMRASRRCLLTRKLANPPYVSKDIKMTRSYKSTSNPNWRVGLCMRKGYCTVFTPLHPRADSHGYVLEHILIAEKALGKSLPPNAIIHHADEQQGRIDPNGLVICPNDAYHLLLHQRSRALNACGNAEWRKCGICKQYDAPNNVHIDTFGHVRHPHCMKMQSAVRRKKNARANKLPLG